MNRIAVLLCVSYTQELSALRLNHFTHDGGFLTNKTLDSETLGSSQWQNLVAENPKLGALSELRGLTPQVLFKLTAFGCFMDLICAAPSPVQAKKKCEDQQDDMETDLGAIFDDMKVQGAAQTNQLFMALGNPFIMYVMNGFNPMSGTQSTPPTVAEVVASITTPQQKAALKTWLEKTSNEEEPAMQSHMDQAMKDKDCEDEATKMFRAGFQPNKFPMLPPCFVRPLCLRLLHQVGTTACETKKKEMKPKMKKCINKAVNAASVAAGGGIALEGHALAQVTDNVATNLPLAKELVMGQNSLNVVMPNMVNNIQACAGDVLKC